MQDQFRSSPSKARLLVVDDHKLMTQMWKVLFEHTGRFEVKEVNDSRLALTAAKNFHPDLLLLDVHMPETNGIEVAAAFNADEGLRHTPIIFLTSLVSKRDALLGRRLEGWLCLSKPINSRELMEAVDSTLSLTRLVPDSCGPA